MTETNTQVSRVKRFEPPSLGSESAHINAVNLRMTPEAPADVGCYCNCTLPHLPLCKTGLG